LSIISVEKLI